MNITLGVLNIGSIGFKGASYQNWSVDTYKQNAKNDEEWSGLYVAEGEDTAKGYLSDMIQSGTAYIHKVSLNQSINLITCLDDSFKTGNIDMKALKDTVRQNGIDVQDTDLFVIKLGILGYAFKCYNNEEGAIEIIIPNVLTNRIDIQPYKSCTLENYVVKSCSTV